MAGLALIDLQEALGDLYTTGDLSAWTLDENGLPAEQTDLQLTADRYLIIPAGWGDTLIVTYTAEPERISAATPDSYEMQCGAQRAAILPLYMASQLYKDDDISIATQYRNEFEAARGSLHPQPGGVRVNVSACLDFD